VDAGVGVERRDKRKRRNANRQGRNGTKALYGVCVWGGKNISAGIERAKKEKTVVKQPDIARSLSAAEPPLSYQSEPIKHSFLI
jgi:hypothetical protein